MLNTLLFAISRWYVNLLKRGGDLIDVFKPRGDVEARLIYASGPRRGEIARIVKGRNIVTSWLSVGGAAPTSGRDLLRRIMVPASFAGSLSADPNATISFMELGSGTVAETTSDAALSAPISPTTKIAIASVEFDSGSPYVTFVTQWDETQANVDIAEVALLSGRTPADFVARKTFGKFSKTSEFVLEIRWTIRF